MEEITLDIEKIKETAIAELYENKFREAVEKEKEKMRLRKPLMQKLFPWKIIVIRRG